MIFGVPYMGATANDRPLAMKLGPLRFRSGPVSNYGPIDLVT